MKQGTVKSNPALCCNIILFPWSVKSGSLQSGSLQQILEARFLTRNRRRMSSSLRIFTLREEREEGRCALTITARPITNIKEKTWTVRTSYSFLATGFSSLLAVCYFPVILSASVTQPPPMAL